MYHRNGQVQQFQSILSEALKEQEIDLHASNKHMFDNKKARHDAMNSLASHYVQMYEVELQRVPCSDLADQDQWTEAQFLERQAQQTQVAQRYREDASSLTAELNRHFLDMQG